MIANIKLIVGLGNPGQQYITTRHNAGFWVVEALANIQHANFKKDHKFKGLISRIAIDNEQCILLLPTTFMNLSGDAVSKIVNFYKISPEAILVIHDELDFPPGILRLKNGGGANSHNGVQDIIDKLGSNNFWRARIGIGKPEIKEDAANYVLATPPALQRQQIDLAINRLLTNTTLLIKGEFAAIMRKLHV